MMGFIIDLDGTLYNGHSPIAGAAEFIEKLKEHGFPYILATNNSSRTPEEVADHLRAMGISAEPDTIFTSAQASAKHIGRLNKGNRIYAIGESGLKMTLTQEGLLLTEDAPDYVVQGIDRQFNYDTLASAVRHIQRGATYILTNPDLLLPSDHELIPGAGSISASIAAASGVQPIVIGKPSAIMMDFAVQRMGIPSNQVWVVGDNASTDIGGGHAAGCRTALVLTGLATPNNVQEQIRLAGVSPDKICSDLTQLWEQLFESGVK
jgi:4-nitrophenyl phosphatase